MSALLIDLTTSPDGSVTFSMMSGGPVKPSSSTQEESLEGSPKPELVTSNSEVDTPGSLLCSC